MKSLCIALVAIIGQASAYPASAEALINGVLEERQQNGGFPEPKPIFNAKEQHVSTSGKHKWVAPNFAKGDQRGPCPGLNAMANHGYLPHNGIGGPEDFIKGTFEVFGMGPDLATILTTIGGTIDGNGVEWSIGGPSKFNPSPAPGLLGTPQGISGSHNKYESDVSPGRGDLYTHGDDYSLQLDQFKELYDMGQAVGDHYSLELLQEFRVKRFQNSIETNPYFFNGPFSGLLVQPAAYEFIYRFMGNKSEAHPRGLLRGDVLMSFFGVTKDKKGKFHHQAGYERIPDNWYKRALTDPYTQFTLTLDTLTAAKNFNQFSSVGGNTGTVNSFKGIDPADITDGVINSENILEGNNLACLAYGFQTQAMPDLISCSPSASGAEAAISKLQQQLAATMTQLSCPVLSNISDSQFQQFPGYSKLKCTGTYVG